MCLSCGCGKPNDKHGDERHITQQDLEGAAKAAQISTQQAAQNIMDGSRTMDAGSASQRRDQQEQRPA